MATITCSNCGLQGHRYTSCGKQLKPELALRKNKHVVSTLLTSTIYVLYLLYVSFSSCFLHFCKASRRSRNVDEARAQDAPARAQAAPARGELHQQEHKMHQEHRLHQELVQGMVLQAIQGLSLHQELLLGLPLLVLPLLLALQVILDGWPFLLQVEIPNCHVSCF